MSDSWDDYAGDWDSDKDVILYSEEAFKSLSNIIQLNGLNILDFGCGTGLLTEKMAPHANRVVALDTSLKMLKVLVDKNLPNVTVIPRPLSEELVAENELLQSKFDLIVASSVCSFLTDYESVLSLIKSLLVPGGTFVQWDWLTLEKGLDFGLTEEIIDAAFKKAGFSSSSITQSFSLSSSRGSMPVLMGVAKNI